MSIKIKRALVSVFDKKNITELAEFLLAEGVEIISSGGTAKLLNDAGIKVQQVSDFTGSPEMMDGRVKTLHPKIHGAILCDRDNPKHIKEAQKNGIKLIDIVVVNLYPFEDTVLKKPQLKVALENIDIGGPALVRSAAKNYKDVAILVNPEKYPGIIKELKENNLTISKKTREDLAIEAFDHVAHYDVVIANYLRKVFGKNEFPDYVNLSFKKLQDLRYGENPHQRAALYIDNHFVGSSVIFSKQLQGKQLSYNNILDTSSAFELIKEFDEPTAVIVKHNNPSGVASSDKILEAYKLSRAVDPEAAFGGVVALNRDVDEKLAQAIIAFFVEVVIAPAFSEKAKEVFKARKNIRLLEAPDLPKKRLPYLDYRSVAGGLLVEDADIKLFANGEDITLKVVTKRPPTEQEMKAMVYAMKIAKYVKSNAIVYARENRAVAIGAGQMKRVDAAKLGAMIANDYYGKDSLKGCVIASDAFFPFRDGVDYAASLGVTAIIQPGGSVRDNEVIAAANEHNIAMVFSGIRHFRH